MADEFSLPVKEDTLEVYCRQHIGESFGSCEAYSAHAINSHDELVAEVERLRGAIHDAFIDGCQVGWDMTGEGYNAEYGGPDHDRLHDEFAALFVERCADK